MREFICLLAIVAALPFAWRQDSYGQTEAAEDRVATTSVIEVTGETLPNLSEEAPVGPYGQPEWTTERIFGASRVYVLPSGRVEFIHFWTPELSEDNVEHKFREEIEIGLPNRLQLDFYQNWGVDEDGDTFYKGSSIELRYALANWGSIPLNPTLYAEWYFNDRAADAYELKLLLGDTFFQRWNWAGNLTFEQETGGERETEFAASAAVSYALIDQRLNLGIEMLCERHTAKNSRADPAIEFLIGPSINIHPTSHSFITLSPLFGTTSDSPRAEVFVAVGFHFDFDGASHPAEQAEAPTSMFGR